MVTHTPAFNWLCETGGSSIVSAPEICFWLFYPGQEAQQWDGKGQLDKCEVDPSVRKRG